MSDHIKKYQVRKHSIWALLVLPFGLVAGSAEPSKPLFKILTGTQGCAIEQITNEVYDEFQHHGVSDDGHWLAVGWHQGKDSGGQSIRGSYVLNLITGEKTHLAEPINHNSSFSPDGQFLIGAQYTPDGKTELYEYDRQTGQATVIAADPNWDFKPSYSPEGQHIIFNSYRSGNSEIYLYHRAAQSLQQLTEHDSYDSHGDFSPDGSQVLFHRQVKKYADGLYDFDLFVHDLATGNETRLTSTPAEESYGAWGPSGERIVFSYNKDNQPGVNHLFIRKADGSLKQLTGGHWQDSYAQWTGDGRYIYFNSNRSGVTNIYRLKMNGSECVQAS